jgi:Rrf2 family iron-sulfur cluster assembly transcriptional regulator
MVQDPSKFFPRVQIGTYVADRQGISEKYLERIVALLVKVNELEGVRGLQGGYRLTKPVSAYTALEIIVAAEGSVAPVACLADKNYPCKRRSVCPTVGLWEEYDQLSQTFFAGKRLDDLVSAYQVKMDAKK